MTFETTKTSSRPTSDPSERPLLVEDLQVAYGRIRALKGVGLEIEDNAVVSIIGANGAGKSTLLKTLSGLIRPREGRILFFGRSIRNTAPERITRMGLVHVPEGRQILGTMTVEENLELGTLGKRTREPMTDRLERVFGYFPVLRGKTSQMGGTLSGGEQQMLAIGRALMGDPLVLMLDEPSLGLAPLLVNEIFRIITVLQGDGKTLLLVEQNARKALLASDRTYLLENGLIALSGPSADLIQNDKVKAAYLGSA